MTRSIHSTTRRTALATAALALASSAFWAAGTAHAAYPEKPITLVVPTAAGGGNDGMARVVALKLSTLLGQQVIVENRAGAAGIIGAQNLRDFRRYAIVAITGAAGILSPPDPFSMIAMALPTVLLYEAAILAVARVEKVRAAKEAAQAAG